MHAIISCLLLIEVSEHPGKLIEGANLAVGTRDDRWPLVKATVTVKT